MNRKTLIVILTVGFCLSAAPAWAGRLATSEISTDANWIVHIDHETFLRSHIGKLIRAEMNARFDAMGTRIDHLDKDIAAPSRRVWGEPSGE